MTAAQMRDWLGKYFLLTTVILGGYIILFSGRNTPLLRVDSQTGMDCFQIIIPTLIAQLTVIFRFFAGAPKMDDSAIPIPPWVVKWPPLLSLALVVVTIVVMAIGNLGENGQPSSPDQGVFKLVVTFYVTILNATTVFIVMKLFETASQKAQQLAGDDQRPLQNPSSPN